MILDTDILIAIIRKVPDAIIFIENTLENQVELCITHVNIWELYQGVYKSVKVQDNLQEVNELISHFKILDFSKEIDLRFGKLINDLKKLGKQIGVMDTLIAAIALENKNSIVTRNVKHFDLTGVVIETW